jgi:hypothetical protein
MSGAESAQPSHALPTAPAVVREAHRVMDAGESGREGKWWSLSNERRMMDR